MAYQNHQPKSKNQKSRDFEILSMIKQNSLVIYNLNTADDPRLIKKYLKSKIKAMIYGKDGLKEMERELFNGEADDEVFFNVIIPSDYNSVNDLLD